MKYAKLQELGRAMGPEELTGTLAQLCQDPRFGAVVGLLEQHREQYVEGGCEQKLAPHHGSLAHNAGSIYALKMLAGALRQACERPKRRGAQMQAPNTNIQHPEKFQ